jgi:hypothetical protein
MRKLLSLAVVLAVAVSLAAAAELEAGHTAYVIHDGQPLLADKDPDAGAVAKLKSHHEYVVVAISGKWVELKTDSATGWVYAGNVQRDEPPEVNDSGFGTEASATTLNAAARGIDDDAKGYADRKGETESANDVIWMEQENDAISKDDVQAYLKDHQLGEYGAGK